MTGNKKRALKLAGMSALYTLTLMSFVFISILQQNVSEKQLLIDKEISILQERISDLSNDLDLIEIRHTSRQDSVLCTLEGYSCDTSSREVLFTNYYIGDEDSSSDITASQLTTKNFEVNENGWYTYQGFVVLATANTTRLQKYLFKEYSSHELYDILTFELDGRFYKGVVLDVCGACYGVSGEDKQRYDIFTTGSVIGKKEGRIYE